MIFLGEYILCVLVTSWLNIVLIFLAINYPNDIFLDKLPGFYNIQNGYFFQHAAVAELADARDLKSLGGQLPYRFNSGQRHQKIKKRPVILPVFFVAGRK